MSLRNLNSIFEEELKQRTEDYISNQIQGIDDTKFFNEPPSPTIHIATNPTDFSSANGNNELSYTPRTFNSGESYLATLPLTPLSELGESPLDGLSWNTLYNRDHSSKSDVGYNYPNVDRSKLDIKSESTFFRTSVISGVGKLISNLGLGGNVSDFLQDMGKEPYIVSKIPQSGKLGGGRFINFGGRDLPINRMFTDAIRLAKFMTSPAGVTFIAKQNFLGVNTKSIFVGKDKGMYKSSQRFKKSYNPLSSLIQAGFRAGGYPVTLFDKTEPGLSSLLGSDEYSNTNILTGNVPFDINKTFTDGSTTGGFNFSDFGNQLLNTVKNAAGVPVTIKEKSSGGDKYTLAKIIKGTELFTAYASGKTGVKGDPTDINTWDKVDGDISTESDGMPFYFKDLRDNSYIFFRAYIEGLTENISPSYASHAYVGRSEPVWTYERAEREISMTLKLFAQTQDELVSIYEKMNRLTSLCYPEYVDEGETGYGNRMKPPLTKLRYGELFGKTNKELMGYIKSLSYMVEQSSPYESGVIKYLDDDGNAREKMARVPKHVIVTIGYQVIHDKSPSLGTKFYGIND